MNEDVKSYIETMNEDSEFADNCIAVLFSLIGLVFSPVVLLITLILFPFHKLAVLVSALLKKSGRES